MPWPSQSCTVFERTKGTPYSSALLVLCSKGEIEAGGVSPGKLGEQSLS